MVIDTDQLIGGPSMTQPGSDIKSTAVVKYAAVEMPAQFQELQQNTDLNQAPSNWLQANSKWENYVRNVSFGKGQFLSSFRIGHCYPELTGEIDVVSDAENIKKLLKIPYSKSHVSMMVHRVGNTLLLDDFDIHKHLLRQQQQQWQWLRKFYYDTIVQNMQSSIKDKKHMIKKNKSRDHLQHRNMFSKFLYYSIGKSGERNSSDGEYYDGETSENSDGYQDMHQGAGYGSSTAQGATMRSSSFPDAWEQHDNVEPEHQRTIEWTFEDIRMLVGTDLPIFGGGTHPCISLRLRDMRNPISVLTGLDYWLDNLICNVPELAMCFHVDGIVQSYELLKTEDIPRMRGSEFSPNVIKDVAQNILSFLKSNATKEGHTYWLFKGPGDDIVKLYDLTTLCHDIEGDRNNNPFTVPVGMLLYRVARNMRTKQGRKKSGTIRTLLKNCLLLLDKKHHSQVVTSAQFLLSDLYISDNIYSLELSPDTSDDSDPEDDTTQSSETANIDGTERVDGRQTVDGTAEVDGTPAGNVEEEGAPMSVDVHALCLPETATWPDKARRNRTHHPPVTGSIEDRCREALHHIAEGISCLEENLKASLPADVEVTDEAEESRPFVEEQATCDPYTAIPLHYTPINPHKTKQSTANNTNISDFELSSGDEDSLSCDLDSANQVSVLNRCLPHETWHRTSKSLLLRKAAIAYYGLAVSVLSSQKYGLTWKYVRLALHSFSALELINPVIADNNQSLLSEVLAVAGDLFLMLAHNKQDLTKHKEDSSWTSEQDVHILSSIIKEKPDSDYEWLASLCASSRQCLECSRRCYKQALHHLSTLNDAQPRIYSIQKRYGNILNELGVHYMNEAATDMLHQGSKQQVKRVWELSGGCLREGVGQFESLADKLNMALLYSNLGRLCRLCAQGCVSDTGQGRREFSPTEAQYFTQAQENYQKALDLLGSRQQQTDVWDSLLWELSSTCFTMATLLQDYAPLTTKAQQQVEDEVIRLMKKALDYTELDCQSPRHTMCIYRAATIHHRMASLYHNAYRNQMDDKKLKLLRNEAEQHYVSAVELFVQTDSACELLRVQLERVALYEYQLNKQTSPVTKLRTLQQALETLLDCHGPIDSLCKQVAAEDHALTQQELDSLTVEGQKLVDIFISRLQFVTLNLVKASNMKVKRLSGHTLEVNKQIYCVVLKSGATSSSTDIISQCQELSKTLSTVSELYTSNHCNTTVSNMDTSQANSVVKKH